MSNKPTRTSYSGLTTYETCPLWYKLHYIDGLQRDTSGPAARRGTRLHLSCEKFLKGELTKDQLPIEFFKIFNNLEQLLSVKAKAEEEWLVGRDWKIHKEEQPDTLLKAIVDIHWLSPCKDVLFILDLKTGQQSSSHGDQLQLYAAMGFARYPFVDEVSVAPLYLEGEAPPTRYFRENAGGIQQFWKSRALLAIDADSYPPTPSKEACQWCPYKKAKGGPCEF